MATPNNFCNTFGKENRNKEKLISRGACISWSPKNLASALIMHSIRWMAKNTDYRFFSGYSDTTAGEIGSIYQACNFIYLGQNFGERFKYFDPCNPKKGWFSDRLFRKPGRIKRYAQQNGIEWQDHWHLRDKILWDQIPSPVVSKIKSTLKEEIARCTRRKVPPKHKYVCIMGKNRRETKNLKDTFSILNPKKTTLSYPERKSTLMCPFLPWKRPFKRTSFGAAVQK